jgi:ParB-like chromosome segregation protein Spo0J
MADGVASGRLPGCQVATLSMARRIEHWPIDRLVPYARNPRTHSEEQVIQIAASIAEFGFTNPILVDTKDGIIAGHGRLLGARKLGLTEVPVIVLDHLTEAQKRAYIIADNKLALNAGWDEELLNTELAALGKPGTDGTFSNLVSCAGDNLVGGWPR